MLRERRLMLWLSNVVTRSLVGEASNKHPLETGGVLLGWRTDDGAVVAGMLGPGPRAMHGRHAFLPDHRWQIEEIQNVFSKTSGDLNYLGDWHTHPNGVAAMSNLDRSTLRRICRRAPNALMTILGGGTGGGWEIVGWQGILTRRLFYRGFSLEVQKIKVFEAPENWPAAIVCD